MDKKETIYIPLIYGVFYTLSSLVNPLVIITRYFLMLINI